MPGEKKMWVIVLEKQKRYINFLAKQTTNRSVEIFTDVKQRQGCWQTARSQPIQKKLYIRLHYVIDENKPICMCLKKSALITYIFFAA